MSSRRGISANEGDAAAADSKGPDAGVSDVGPACSVLAEAKVRTTERVKQETGTMTRPFRRVSAVAVPTAGAAAVPAGGVPAGAAAAPASNEREYGLYAIVAGLLVLAGLDAAVLAVLSHNVNGAVAVIGAISAPIVAMVSAYFGMKVGARSGSASAAAADKARQEAETEVKSLLGHMAPDRAVPVMRKLGIPVADDDAVAA